jgi:hypothetical protein
MPTVSKAAKSTRERAWSIPELREPRYSQSLERGLAILGSLLLGGLCSGSRTSQTISG